MAPQTRSAAKSSPGRSTRNSVYGRSPLPAPKPRKSQADKTPLRAQAHNTADKVTLNDSSTQGTPWLSCRDAYGVMTTVASSDTGEGVHVRWYYSEDDIEVDENEDRADAEMTVSDQERGVTPVTTRPSHVARHTLIFQTPIAPEPFDAGSVIQTPVKKARPLQARPLQPSPPRIGDKGIRCLYEKGGVLRDLNGGVRIVLRHPIGSSANLSREQVERLQNEREDEIFRVQIEKMLGEKRRIEEEACFSDSGYEDSETDTDFTSTPRGLRREQTIFFDQQFSNVASHDEGKLASGFFRGPQGELLDRHGRQMLGREGTILMDPTCALPMWDVKKEVSPVSTEDAGQPSPGFHGSNNLANGLRRPRFGPEGTELID